MNEKRQLMSYVKSECPNRSAYLCSMVRDFSVRRFILHYQMILEEVTGETLFLLQNMQAELHLLCSYIRHGDLFTRCAS